MKMAFVIASLNCGGAERIITIMANYYASRGEDVSLITLADEEGDFYQVDKAVKRISLGRMKESTNVLSGIGNNIRRIIDLGKKFREISPEVVISFMPHTNIVAILAAMGLNVPVIVSERNDKVSSIGYLWERLREYVYPFAGAVVVQTESMRHWATNFIKEERVVTIPNPVLPVSKEHTEKLPEASIKSPFITAMGRLVPQKGFDMLLEAFARCSNKEWSLVILGEGPGRDSLVSKIGELGISDRVHLIGKIKNPARILSKSDMFVLSSRFEGFPNALLEAMSLGLPVISFDCPSGPSEIIHNGVNGLLVPANDVDGLVSSLDTLMNNEDLRAYISSNASEVVERFSLNTVIGKWDRVILQA